MNKFLTFMLSILVMCMCGCAKITSESVKYEDNAYKTLAITALTYDTVMTKLGELHTANKIDDDTAIKAISFGKKFTPIYLTAVNALDVFIKNPTTNTKDVVVNAIRTAIASLDELVTFSKELGLESPDVYSLLDDDSVRSLVYSIITH